MNDFKKIFLYLSAAIGSLLLIVLVVEIRTNIALNDYSMLPEGVKVVDKVVLGRRERTLSKGLGRAYDLEFENGIFRAFRRGAIELVCTNQNFILLIMKDRKPHGGGADTATLSISGDMENGIFKGETEIKRMEFLSNEYFDTLASDPLSDTEIASILQALKDRKSNNIGLSIFDGGNGFIGNAKLSDVEMLITQCKKPTNNQ
jgi:hypothetical protein